MYCQFKCQSCDQWHSLNELSLSELKVALYIFMLDPPAPFDRWVWAMIIGAEIKKRGG